MNEIGELKVDHAATAGKETVGKVSAELSMKAPESRDPVELQREMTSEYMANLLEKIDEGYRKYPGDFYVVVLTKNERLMENVFRNYFFHRKSCPTPDYDQSVYRYNKKLERVEYLWTIPSKDACIHLKENAMLVAPEERQLLGFVLQFADDTLFRYAKKLNGEQVDSPLLIH